MSERERPRPPGAAYALVLALLPDDYLTVPPPEKGARVEVMGADGVATVWDVPEASVADVVNGARRVAGVRCRIAKGLP